MLIKNNLGKKAQVKNLAFASLIALALLCGGLLAWQFDWLNFRSNFNPNYKNLVAECPKIVEDMGMTCCKPTESGEMKAVVSAVYVNAKCECPYPTTFLQIAPESENIQICECGCPGEE